MFTHYGTIIVLVFSFFHICCLGVNNSDTIIMLGEKKIKHKKTIECEPVKLWLDSGGEVGEIHVVFDGQQSWLLCNNKQNKLVCDPGEIFIWLKSNAEENVSYITNTLTVKKFIPSPQKVKIVYVCERLY